MPVVETCCRVVCIVEVAFLLYVCCFAYVRWCCVVGSWRHLLFSCSLNVSLRIIAHGLNLADVSLDLNVMAVLPPLSLYIRHLAVWSDSCLVRCGLALLVVVL